MVNTFMLTKNNNFKVLALEASFVFLLAIALGHAGPYDTYSLFSLPTRLVYWVLIIILPWALFKGLYYFTKKFTPPKTPKILITILLTPLFVIFGSAITTLINLNVGLYTPKTFFDVWPYSILVWLMFSFCLVIPMSIIAKELSKEQRKSGVTTMMEFFDHKLPDSLSGSKLIALKAEDHYLRVITDTGNALILMKFEDALAALNGYPGIQTHRSWWLASSQLKNLGKLSSSTHSIVIPDGTEVPISRRKRKLVNEYIVSLCEAN